MEFFGLTPHSVAKRLELVTEVGCNYNYHYSVIIVHVNKEFEAEGRKGIKFKYCYHLTGQLHNVVFTVEV